MYGLTFGIFTFDLGPILKVKVLYISTTNILEMVIDRVKISIAIKLQVTYGLSTSIITSNLGPL